MSRPPENRPAAGCNDNSGRPEVANKLRLDIPILLPGVLDPKAARIARLSSEIASQEGVEKAHIVGAGDAARLCIHYDPAVLPLPRIRELVSSAGARISDKFGHVLWQVYGIWHDRGAREVAEQLHTLPGVLEAEASAKGTLRVEFDRTQGSEQSIRDALDAMGATIRDVAVAAPHQPGQAQAAAPDDAARDGGDHGLLGPNTTLVVVVNALRLLAYRDGRQTADRTAAV